MPLPGPRAVFRPILPKAGTHLLRLPPPRSLLFSLDGGVLMGLCMPQGVEKLALERGDAAADGGKDEAGGQTDGLWVCQPGSSVRLPAHPRSCRFFPLLASPKRSCHYQSENKSKVTAWEMRFRNYPFERTKQTMPNVSALKVWHLTRGRGWPVSFWAADVLSLGVVPVLLERLQVCQE